MDTKEKLSSTTIWLHWIVAILMIFMTAAGIYIDNFEAETLFDIHTSLGVLILVAVIPRVIWRYKHGWPVAVGNYTRVEHIGGKVVHWTLILATLLMPLSGILMAVAGGHGLHIFELELLAETPDPANPDEALALSPALAEVGSAIHGLFGKVLPIAIVLHIVGALKHHLIDKDETLRRMLGLQPR